MSLSRHERCRLGVSVIRARYARVRTTEREDATWGYMLQRASKVKWFPSTYARRLGNVTTKCCYAVVRRLIMQMMSGAGSSGPAAAASTIDGEHAGVQQCCYGGRAMRGGQ